MLSPGSTIKKPGSTKTPGRLMGDVTITPGTCPFLSKGCKGIKWWSWRWLIGAISLPTRADAPCRAASGRKGSRSWDDLGNLGEVHPPCRCAHGCAHGVQSSPCGPLFSWGLEISSPGQRRERAEKEWGKQHAVPYCFPSLHPNSAPKALFCLMHSIHLIILS